MRSSKCIIYNKSLKVCYFVTNTQLKFYPIYRWGSWCRISLNKHPYIILMVNAWAGIGLTCFVLFCFVFSTSWSKHRHIQILIRNMNWRTKELCLPIRKWHNIIEESSLWKFINKGPMLCVIKPFLLTLFDFLINSHEILWQILWS